MKTQRKGFAVLAVIGAIAAIASVAFVGHDYYEYRTQPEKILYQRTVKAQAMVDDWSSPSKMQKEYERVIQKLLTRVQEQDKKIVQLQNQIQNLQERL